MIRVIALLVAAGVLGTMVTGLSPWFFIVPLAVLAVFAYGSGAAHLKCPACGKRIKLGYKACHHCSWSAVPRQR